MKKSLNLNILTSLILFTFTLASPVFAQLAPLPTEPGTDAVGICALQNLFGNILTIVVGFAGLAAFIMLITGGFKWMTSGGDPKKAESAKNTITSAVIGMFALVLIWLILLFIKQFTGVQVTVFTIPGCPPPAPPSTQ